MFRTRHNKYKFTHTCVSDRFSVWASALRSAPTTYWLLSNACSNLSSCDGENAVRTRFGFRNGCSRKSVWVGGSSARMITFNSYWKLFNLHTIAAQCLWCVRVCVCVCVMVFGVARMWPMQITERYRVCRICNDVIIFVCSPSSAKTAAHVCDLPNS